MHFKQNPPRKIVGEGRIALQNGTLSLCYMCYWIVPEFSGQEIGNGKTGHRPNGYQKTSDKQVQNESKVLA